MTYIYLAISLPPGLAVQRWHQTLGLAGEDPPAAGVTAATIGVAVFFAQASFPVTASYPRTHPKAWS